MKRLVVIVGTIIMFSVLFCNAAHSAGVIQGQLLWNEKPAAGVVVTFFNSENGEIITTSRADIDGFFEGLLKEGQYKLHFSFTKQEYCFDEFYMLDLLRENVFDLATPITVIDGQNTDLGSVTVFYKNDGRRCPLVCDMIPGEASGGVFDSSTGTPIPVPGIRLQFKDAATAFPQFEDRLYYTDEFGRFDIILKMCPDQADVKIRFSDPNGVYSSEYFGKTDVDDFSQGEVVDLANPIKLIDYLGKMPPAEQIGGIIEDVLTNLSPEDAQPVVSSLQQGQDLLKDTNPNNDKGTCGTLSGAENKLNGLLSNGRLTQEEAAALAASIDALKTDLACKK